jgi:hypothetical protein
MYPAAVTIATVLPRHLVGNISAFFAEIGEYFYSTKKKASKNAQKMFMFAGCRLQQ